MTANGLEETIAEALSNGQGGEAIRQAFQRAPIPAEVERDLQAA